MTPIRRLDHVALAVHDTEVVLRHVCGHLGLTVVHQEELASPRLRLTYVDVGNTFLQLVEPLDSDSEISRWLEDHGEGLHHLCFGVDEVAKAVVELSIPANGSIPPGQGRGRPSAFVSDGSPHGIVLECTEFDLRADVESTVGWLP
jgi:methylmalonyl-CoA/ethylmalonyl-CoA epimerase